MPLDLDECCSMNYERNWVEVLEGRKCSWEEHRGAISETPFISCGIRV